jgi:hypothetical protein
MEMNKDIQIRVSENDKYIPINIYQDFDFLKILSLKISQSDLYSIKNSNYGVLVGNIKNNNGIGIPNAKVSIFIPLDENENETIKNLYPFNDIRVKDNFGMRYNLLPKQKQHEYHTPVGSFLSYNEINSSEIEYVYNKYYKYTTVTNINGDYMFIGTPVGEYDVFVDCDISDIDVLSVKPHNLITNGYNVNLFNSKTRFKSDTNLDVLPQIIKSSSKIYLKPFWGDNEIDGSVGINRQDFILDFNLTPTAIFCGSLLTFDTNAFFRTNCTPNTFKGSNHDNWRSVIFSEDRLRSGGVGKIECIRETINGDVETINVNGVIDEDGIFIVEVPMNLGYKILNNNNELVDSTNGIGIPTKANVRFRISIPSNTDSNEIRSAFHLCPSFEDENDVWNFDFDISDFKNYKSNNKKYPFVELEMNNIYSVFYSGIPYCSKRAVNQDKRTTFNLETHSVISLCRDAYRGSGLNNPFPYQINIGGNINKGNNNTNQERYDLCNLNGVNGSIIFYPFQSHNGIFCNCKSTYPRMGYLTIDDDFKLIKRTLRSGQGLIFRNGNNFYYSPFKIKDNDSYFESVYVNYLNIIKIGELKTDLDLNKLLPPSTTSKPINFEARKNQPDFLFKCCEMGIKSNFRYEDGSIPLTNDDIELKTRRVNFLIKNNYIDVDVIEKFIYDDKWFNYSNFNNKYYEDYIKSGRNFLFYFGVRKDKTVIDRLKLEYF